MAGRPHRSAGPPPLGPRRIASARDPELRGGARPARGVRTARTRPGGARADRRRAPPRGDRLLGCARGAHAVHVSVRVPPHRLGAAERRPDRRGGRAQPWRGSSAGVRARHAARAPPLDRRRLAPRRALRPLRLRRGLADGVLDADDRDLRPLRVAARARVGCDPRAGARRARPRDRARRVALQAAWRDLPQHAGCRTHGEDRAARALALARTRVLLRGRGPVPRPPGRRPRLVDRERRPDLRAGRRGLVGCARLGVARDGRSDRCRARRASRGAPRLALSLRALALARTPHVPPERTSGDRRGAGARVRGGAHRLARLPEPRAAPRRVRHSLHAVRARLDARLARRGQPTRRGGSAITRPAGRSARRWPSSCRSRDRESSPALHSSS